MRKMFTINMKYSYDVCSRGEVEDGPGTKRVVREDRDIKVVAQSERLAVAYVEGRPGAPDSTARSLVVTVKGTEDEPVLIEVADDRTQVSR